MTANVHNGGAWRTATGLYVHNGGAWRTVQNAYVYSGGAWREFFTAATFTAANESVTDTEIGIAPTAGIKYNSDGTTTKVRTQMGDIAGTNWISPSGAGSGTGRYVKATVTSGSLTSGTTGSYVEISTNPQWTRTRATPGTSACTIQFDFSFDGVNSVLTVSVTLTATFT
jgi:hypothetical protein